MAFKDFNFKMVVIEALIETGDLADEMETLEDKYGHEEPEEDFGPIPQIKKALEKLELTEKQLAKIKTLVFDGGNEIYQILAPNWDGEDLQFDTKNISGIELLPNLESITAISMLDCDDLRPLLNCPKLKNAFIPEYCSKDEETIAKLREKGVEITRN